MNLGIHDVLVWRFTSDILFLCALAYLGYRLLRDPYTARRWRELRELENGLRHVVREADGAGRQLGESLRARQGSLEHLLADLDAAESRVSQAVQVAESTKQTLASDIEKVRNIARELFGRSVAVNARPQRTQHIEEQSESFIPQPERHNDSHLNQESEQSRRNVNQRAQQVAAQTKPTAAARVNIYGEPLDPIESPAQKALLKAQARQSVLGSQIEKQRIASEQQNNRATSQAMQGVYKKAEDLLRAGNDLNSIQRTLNLSEDDLRMLEQVQQNEVRVSTSKRAPEIAPPSRRVDARLGVLANPIQRERRVL